MIRIALLVSMLGGCMVFFDGDDDKDPPNPCGLTYCTPALLCGNGVLDMGEACDDGNYVSGDGCSQDCRSTEVCGNGYLDVGEQCDDGNTIDGDGCAASCHDPSCGNAVLDMGEVCDDGNNVSGDGCRADCASNEVCGNGIVDTVSGEQCDDGNSNDNDGCTNACKLPN
jgi:cysteine-rich repeat protein